MPIDWTASMSQTFEFYVVNPSTWKDERLLQNVKSGSCNYDISSATLGSANFVTDSYVGECYIRPYLVCGQNGFVYKYPLGTYLVQTPSSMNNGKRQETSMDGYTPLIELTETKPPIGYSLLKDTDIMSTASQLANEHMRGPVISAESNDKLGMNFIANIDDNWLDFILDLIKTSKFGFYLDEYGRVLFQPNQEIDSMQPTWVYNDDNSSILYSDITVDHDLYGIPNVVEVLYSNPTNNTVITSRVVNDNPGSPTSIQQRGREILYRETTPNISGIPNQEQLDAYAETLLKNLSSIEYTISYTHGYCPVRVGDCVRLTYKRAGLENVRAKIISQSIKFEPGCPVTEKAVFKSRLWR